MIPAIPIVDNAIALIKDALDRFIPDKSAVAQAKAALDQLRLQQDAQEFLSSADIVKTEAASEGWLTRSWRPLAMLWLMGMITLHLFGLTDTAHVTEAQYDQFWELFKLGLGGYVIGRSAEKTAGPLIGAVVSAVKGSKN